MNNDYTTLPTSTLMEVVDIPPHAFIITNKMNDRIVFNDIYPGIMNMEQSVMVERIEISSKKKPKGVFSLVIGSKNYGPYPMSLFNKITNRPNWYVFKIDVHLAILSQQSYYATLNYTQPQKQVVIVLRGKRMRPLQ